MGFVTGTETTLGATLVGAFGGAMGSITAVTLMIAAQLGYYKSHSKHMVPVLSTATTVGMRVRLIPLNGGDAKFGHIEGVTHDVVTVRFDDATGLGTQDIPRGYWDTDADACREKGQAWFEVKKAYMKSKCCEYEGQACCIGACIGMCAADGVDEMVSGGGVHACDVLPDATCAGCMCMMCVHGTRLLCKSMADKRQKDARAAEREGVEATIGRPAPHWDSLQDDEPALGKPVVDDQGFTRGTRGISTGGGLPRRARGSPRSTSTVRRTRGAAQGLDAGDPDPDYGLDDYWEEKQRRSQIEQMYEQGGDPTDPQYRHLFQRSQRGDSAVSGAPPAARRGRRGVGSALPSAADGDTVDLASGVSQSHVSQSHVSQSQYGHSHVDDSRVPPSPPRSGVRLGVGGGTAWDGY